MDNSKTKPVTNTPSANFQHLYGKDDQFKDQLEAIAGTFGGRRSGGVETEPRAAEAGAAKPVETVEEIPTSPEIEKKPELAGYIEKVERDTETIKPIVDDYTQQILLKSVDPTNVKVKLPLTVDQVQTGLHHKVWESIRWLAEWCVRQVKMLGGRAEYKQE